MACRKRKSGDRMAVETNLVFRSEWDGKSDFLQFISDIARDMAHDGMFFIKDDELVVIVCPADYKKIMETIPICDIGSGMGNQKDLFHIFEPKHLTVSHVKVYGMGFIHYKFLQPGTIMIANKSFCKFLDEMTDQMFDFRERGKIPYSDIERR